jgi:hypothetical protein
MSFTERLQDDYSLRELQVAASRLNVTPCGSSKRDIALSLSLQNKSIRAINAAISKGSIKKKKKSSSYSYSNTNITNIINLHFHR